MSCGEYKEVSTDFIFRLKITQEVEVSHCSVLTECRPAVRPASLLEHRPRLFLMLSLGGGPTGWWIKVGLGFT